jgi:hypothetical protein
MELLLLLLLIPVVWLMLLPSRIAGSLKRHRYAAAAVVAIVALGGLLVLQFRQPEQTHTDYAQGDSALRALLE